MTTKVKLTPELCLLEAREGWAAYRPTQSGEEQTRAYNYMPDWLEPLIPKLYSLSDEEQKDPIVYIKFFTRGRWTYYATEYSRVAPDGYPELYFGYILSPFGSSEDEWYYMAGSQLRENKIEVDLWWKPKPFSECDRMEIRDEIVEETITLSMAEWLEQHKDSTEIAQEQHSPVLDKEEPDMEEKEVSETRIASFEYKALPNHDVAFECTIGEQTYQIYNEISVWGTRYGSVRGWICRKKYTARKWYTFLDQTNHYKRPYNSLEEIARALEFTLKNMKEADKLVLIGTSLCPDTYPTVRDVMHKTTPPPMEGEEGDTAYARYLRNWQLWFTAHPKTAIKKVKTCDDLKVLVVAREEATNEKVIKALDRQIDKLEKEAA